MGTAVIFNAQSAKQSSLVSGYSKNWYRSHILEIQHPFVHKDVVSYRMVVIQLSEPEARRWDN
jgi:hypothetical protein